MFKIAILIPLLALTGCVHENQYEWGTYPETVSAKLLEGDGSDPETQAQRLSQIIEQAHEKKVGPGIYAELGYAQHQKGDDRAAIASFQQEKALYPDAAPLMDRMINTLTKKTKSTH